MYKTLFFNVTYQFSCMNADTRQGEGQGLDDEENHPNLVWFGSPRPKNCSQLYIMQKCFSLLYSVLQTLCWTSIFPTCSALNFLDLYNSGSCIYIFSKSQGCSKKYLQCFPVNFVFLKMLKMSFIASWHKLNSGVWWDVKGNVQRKLVFEINYDFSMNRNTL